MPSVLFTNVLMLAGLAALAIPVILHLLLKRKKKRLRFSTNQFFAKLDEQSSQRRKLRNWLLLALRCLLVALLVLAFARPYLPQSALSASAPKKHQAVVVLDRSASMRALGSDGQRWNRAKEQIRKLGAALRPDDRIALISCSTHTDVLAGFAPPVAIDRLLNDLQPTFGTADLAQGLQQAVKLLSASDPTALATIYLVSDLQKSACQHLASCPIPRHIEVKWVCVGDLNSPNLAISQLEVETRDGGRPQVRVGNYSDEDSPAAALEFSVDGKLAAASTFSLKGGAFTNFELSIPPLKPGWHDAKAVLRTKDALEIDNTSYATWLVPEPLQVLVVESRKTKRVFEEEMFFINSALDPSKDSTNSIPSAFNLVPMAPEEAISKLSGAQAKSPFDVVILPGLKELPSGSGKALAGFVEAGGGLLLMLGEGVSANRYNHEFRELLPAQLGNLEASTEVGAGWHLADYDTNSLMFAAFRRPNSGDLRLPEFTQRWSLVPADGAVTLAYFDDGAPLLVTRAVGMGRVALVDTSADTRWNDWPKHKTFVPWVHGLGKFLARKTFHQVQPETNSFVAEADCDLETGSGSRQAQFKLQPPAGKELLLKADEQGRLRDPGLSLPGIYSLRDPGGKELRRLAVNLPAQESDLRALRPTEAQEQLVRVEEPEKTTLVAGLFGAKSNQKEFWSVLLLGVVALLFIELIVANRTLA